MFHTQVQNYIIIIKLLISLMPNIIDRQFLFVISTSIQFYLKIMYFLKCQSGMSHSKAAQCLNFNWMRILSISKKIDDFEVFPLQLIINWFLSVLHDFQNKTDHELNLILNNWEIAPFKRKIAEHIINKNIFLCEAVQIPYLFFTCTRAIFIGIFVPLVIFTGKKSSYVSLNQKTAFTV